MSVLTRLLRPLTTLLPRDGVRAEPITPNRLSKLEQERRALDVLARSRPQEKLAARTGGNGATGRFWFLPYLDSITGETEGMRTAYKQMLKSPYVKSGLMTKVLGVASLDWQIQPANPDSPRDKEACDFLRFCIESVPEGMPAIVQAVTLPRLIDGYAVAEKVVRIEQKDPKWSGKAVLDNIKSRSTDLYDLEIDEHNNVHGIRGKGPNAGNLWPINDFIYTRNMPIYDSPGGMSDLRAAYGDYWILDTVTKLRAIHAEKYTSPFLLGEYIDENDQSPLETALAAAKAGTWMTVPEGVKVQAVTMASAGESDFKSFSEDCKKGMLIAILGAYLQVLEGQVSDGAGNAAVSKSISELYQWHLAVQVQEIFNRQIFPQLIDLNYAGVGYPRLTLGSVSEQELAAILANFSAAQALGLKLSKAQTYERTSIEPPSGPDDELSQPAQASPFGPMGGGGGALPFSEQKKSDGFHRFGSAEGWKGPFEGPRGGRYWVSPTGEKSYEEPGSAPAGKSGATDEGPAKEKEPHDMTRAEYASTHGGKAENLEVATEIALTVPGTTHAKLIHGDETLTATIPDFHFVTYKNGRTDKFILKKWSGRDGQVRYTAHAIDKKGQPYERPEAGLQLRPSADGVPVLHTVASEQPGTGLGKALVREMQKEYGDWKPSYPMSQQGAKLVHRMKVEQALAAGKRVSPEVLADYPELAAKSANIKHSEAFHQFAADDWNGPFKGPRGGTFWINRKTGQPTYENPATHTSPSNALDDKADLKDLVKIAADPKNAPVVRQRLNQHMDELSNLAEETVKKYGPPKPEQVQAHNDIIDQATASLPPRVSASLGGKLRALAKAAPGKLAEAGKAFAGWLGKMSWKVLKPVLKSLGDYVKTCIKAGAPLLGGTAIHIAGIVAAGAAIAAFASFPVGGSAAVFYLKLAAVIPVAKIAKGIVNTSTRAAGRVMYKGPGAEPYSEGDWEQFAAEGWKGPFKGERGGTYWVSPSGEKSYEEPGAADIKKSKTDKPKDEGEAKATAAEPVTAVKTLSPKDAESAQFDAPSPTEADTGKPWVGTVMRGRKPAQPGQQTDAGDYGKGMYWSGDGDRAAAYARPIIGTKGKEGQVHVEQVKLDNPLVFKTAKEAAQFRSQFADPNKHRSPQDQEVAIRTHLGLMERGHDGVVVYDTEGTMTARPDKPFEVVKLGDIDPKLLANYPELEQRYQELKSGRNKSPNIKHSESFSDYTPAPHDEVALAGPDGRRAAELLAMAKDKGATILQYLTRRAVKRLLNSPNPSAVHTLFDAKELQALADSLAATNATANMLGRSRVREKAQQAELSEQGLQQFGENDRFLAFVEPPPPLPPTAAIDYFKKLVPSLAPQPTLNELLRREAFTLAAATDEVLLGKVKDIITNSLITGASGGPQAINAILDAAGVSPRSPQYGEMVYRTNMMDSYTRGAQDELADPDMQEMFPVWQYLGIRDGRQGKDHEPHFDRYYPNSATFEQVRGERVYNCRCCPAPISKYEWRRLQANGARVENFSEQFADNGWKGPFEGPRGGKFWTSPSGEKNYEGPGDGGAASTANDNQNDEPAMQTTKSESIEWGTSSADEKRNNLETVAPELIGPVQDWADEKGELSQEVFDGDWPKVWYHGTQSENLSGDLRFDKGAHDWGHGAYLTSDPGYASIYSRDSEAAGQAETISELQAAGVHPVVARLSNPLIPERTPLAFFDEFAASVGSEPFSDYGYENTSRASEEIFALIRKHTGSFTNYCKAKGFDGVVTTLHESGSGSEGSGQKVAIVFDGKDTKPLNDFSKRKNFAEQFAEWKPYTNPKTKRSGAISSGGRVVYGDLAAQYLKGKPETTPAKKEAAPAKPAATKKAAPAAEPAKAKEPWEMTREEYDGPNGGRGMAKGNYESEIETALKDGKPVPRDIAKEFDAIAADHQPHLLTAKEYRQATGRDSILSAQGPRAKGEANKQHRAAVVAALAAGKNVPPEVLADYPDLAKPAPAVKKPATKKPAQAAKKPASEPHMKAFRAVLGDDYANRMGSHFDRLFKEFDDLPEKEKEREYRGAQSRGRSFQDELGAKVAYAGIRVGLTDDGMRNVLRAIRDESDAAKPSPAAKKPATKKPAPAKNPPAQATKKATPAPKTKPAAASQKTAVGQASKADPKTGRFSFEHMPKVGETIHYYDGQGGADRTTELIGKVLGVDRNSGLRVLARHGGEVMIDPEAARPIAEAHAPSQKLLETYRMATDPKVTADQVKQAVDEFEASNPSGAQVAEMLKNLGFSRKPKNKADAFNMIRQRVVGRKGAADRPNA